MFIKMIYKIVLDKRAEALEQTMEEMEARLVERKRKARSVKSKTPETQE